MGIKEQINDGPTVAQIINGERTPEQKITELGKLIAAHETKLDAFEKRIKAIEQEREGWFANQKKVDSETRTNKW